MSLATFIFVENTLQICEDIRESILPMLIDIACQFSIPYPLHPTAILT